MSADGPDQRTLSAAVTDARLAEAEFDGARAWLEEARTGPMEPIAAEVWAFDTAFQRNDIALPFPMHAFVTNLVTSRVGYAFNTRTFLDTLLQYNTDLKQFSANVRFDLIHRPLSDLFIVYNEQQLTTRDITAGRGLIVKYTHMLAF